MESLIICWSLVAVMGFALYIQFLARSARVERESDTLQHPRILPASELDVLSILACVKENGLARRICVIMTHNGFTAQEMALVMDTSLERVKRLIWGYDNHLSNRELTLLRNKLGLSATWLTSGDGPMHVDDADPQHPQQVDKAV